MKQMIIGIGVDIVKTARFENMTQHFMERVFTSRERAYLLTKGHVSAAGLFAAKEAVAKALGTGFRGFWPDDIEIVHDAMGKPKVVLHKEAALLARKLAKGKRRFGHGYTVYLSISHTDTDAIAYAMVQRV